MNEQGRYEASQNSWWKYDPKHLAVAAIEPRETVLDVGCSYGQFGAALSQKGCVVDGVEFDEDAWQAAQSKMRRVYRLDLNFCVKTGLDGIQERYDVITFMDVLEHCIDPDAVLAAFKPLLNPGGRVYISVPNIANIRTRLSLLRGDFDYTEYGVLDKTHLRFFTQRTAVALLQSHFRNVSVVGYTPSVERLRSILPLAPGLLALQFVICGRDS